MSAGLEGVQNKNIPLSIADEYAEAEDKTSKRTELKQRYPGCETTINFLCGCNSKGEPRPDIQLVIGSSKYMLDFIKENPIPFKVSNKCCNCCKKQLAHSVQKIIRYGNHRRAPRRRWHEISPTQRQYVHVLFRNRRWKVPTPTFILCFRRGQAMVQGLLRNPIL